MHHTYLSSKTREVHTNPDLVAMFMLRNVEPWKRTERVRGEDRRREILVLTLFSFLSGPENKTTVNIDSIQGASFQGVSTEASIRCR